MTQIALTPVVKRTYEDLAAIPPDLQRWELIEGEFYGSPAPGSFHQIVSGRLFVLLTSALVPTNEALVIAAPFDVVLSRFNTVEPDLVVVRRENAGRISKRGLEGVPDLVVEILSESNRMQDLSVKRALYSKFEVPEYWLVDPDAKTVEVLVHTGEGFGQHAVFSGEQVALSSQFESVSAPLTGLFAPI